MLFAQFSVVKAGPSVDPLPDAVRNFSFMPREIVSRVHLYEYARARAFLFFLQHLYGLGNPKDF